MEERPIYKHTKSCSDIAKFAIKRRKWGGSQQASFTMTQETTEQLY